MTALTPEILAALATFAIASSVTPGPNNAMLLASGANFGLRRTLPHMAGVVLGFAAMIVGVGLGLGFAFNAYPALYTAVQVIGGTYLLYLAYRIATAEGMGAGPSSGRPMSFWQAVAFQWVNPKAWAGAVGAIAAFAPPEGYFLNVLVIGAVFLVVNTPTVTLWTSMGAALRRFLDRPKVLRAFNRSMAVLLVASLWPLGLELWEWISGS